RFAEFRERDGLSLREPFSLSSILILKSYSTCEVGHGSHFMLKLKTDILHYVSFMQFIDKS
ncbi:hypothetical protein, partial [Leptospira kirschneri]|uniref:hypothetical protein n=1 Tax=Leptospira kirschneri TaxID=29507 RepID=UPI001C400A83